MFIPINPISYDCSSCKYKTDNKKDFNKHILTPKHLRLTNYLQKIPIQEKIFICECGKEYKHRQSLYTHKQKCTFKITENINETNKDVNIDTSDKNFILTLIQQNNELQKQMTKHVEKFNCEICDFKCCKQSNFDKHNITSKHKNNEKKYNLMPKNDNKNLDESEQIFTCECGSIYKHYSGLWRHKKNCKIKEENNNSFNKELIMLLIKENSELKNIMMKFIENDIPNII